MCELKLVKITIEHMKNITKTRKMENQLKWKLINNKENKQKYS